MDAIGFSDSHERVRRVYCWSERPLRWVCRPYCIGTYRHNKLLLISKLNVTADVSSIDWCLLDRRSEGYHSDGRTRRRVITHSLRTHTDFRDPYFHRHLSNHHPRFHEGHTAHTTSSADKRRCFDATFILHLQRFETNVSGFDSVAVLLGGRSMMIEYCLDTAASLSKRLPGDRLSSANQPWMNIRTSAHTRRPESRTS